nr:DUF2938 domain-containing protein [Luteimonas galliterrae]
MACILLTGLGATAAIDLWSILRKRLLGIPLPDFGLVGRWLGHMPRGRFRHEAIATAPPVRGEHAIGWIAHYLTGAAFAAVLFAIWPAWIRHPIIGPALAVGIGTVAAPFLLMQPGMGAGIAASRMPRPAVTRFHSLVTHAIFGIGLYAVGSALSAFCAA